MTRCVQYAVKCVLYRTELWSFICGDFLKVKSVYDHNPIDVLHVKKFGIHQKFLNIFDSPRNFDAEYALL